MRRTAILLFLLRLVKMAVSILILKVSAKYFGVSFERDSWTIAYNAILVIDTAVWGPLNETFRAKFVSLKESIGSNGALQKVRSMLTFINIITLLIIFLIFLFPIDISKLIAPKYDSILREHFIKMLLVIAPSLFLNQVNQFFISILNSFNIFYIPEIASLVSGVLNIFLIIFLAPKIGIYSMAIAYYCNLLILTLALVYQLWKNNLITVINFRLSLIDVKPFLIFAAPFFIPYFFGQFNSIVEKSLASTLYVGAVSIIDYARKFSDIFVSTISSVLTTMLVPVLASSFAQKDFNNFNNSFKGIFSIGSILVTFVIVLFSVCPTAFINLLYNSGKISLTSLKEIALLTMYYSWSTIFIFFYLIFGMTLLSTSKGKFYAILGSLAQLIMILMNFTLKDRMGILIFPVSLIVSHAISSILMLILLPYRIPKVYKLLFMSLVQVTLAVAFVYSIDKQLNLNTLNPILQIFIDTLITVLFLLVFATIFRTEEKFMIKKIIDKITFKKS